MNKNLIRHTTADKLARQSEVRQLEVGQYPQVVLAYGKQLDTLDLADKWLTPRIGMDVPGGRLQVGSSLRLLITAHCGSARWVVWKGLRIKSPPPLSDHSPSLNRREKAEDSCLYATLGRVKAGIFLH